MSLIKPVRAIKYNCSHPLSQGLAACWLFNEGCGLQAADSSGGRFNLSMTGGTPDWTAGNHGSAVYFNSGNSEYMELDAAPVANFPCTILAWICPDDVTQGNYYYPLYIANKDVTNQAWGLLLNYGKDGEVSLVANTNLSWRPVSTKVLAASQWHQIAGVIAGAGDRRCYVDGGNKGVNTGSITNPSGLNRISVGRAGDSTPGYYFPGKIGCVFIWKRALTDSEIAWLYHEPFAMFDTDSRAKLLSFPVTVNNLFGTITAQSRTTGKINTINKQAQLEKFWLMDVIANGMTGNSFKLSTVLSMGWFWARNAGCSVLYRGVENDHVDFSDILNTAGPDADNISPPIFCTHEKEKSYYYVLRRFNKCGIPEQTNFASVKVSLESDGDIEAVRPNSIFKPQAEIIDGDKIQLSWLFNSLSQKSEPAAFRIYFDNGSGEIDFENPLAVIEYTGQETYRYQSPQLEAGTYLYAIKTADAEGLENKSSDHIKVQIINRNITAIEIINSENT
jgi:hypothetical protein